MNMVLLAQHLAHSWNFGDILVLIIVVAACVGIVLIALRASGIQVPPWFWQIFWIVLVAFVAIVAIRFLLSL